MSCTAGDKHVLGPVALSSWVCALSALSISLLAVRCAHRHQRHLPWMFHYIMGAIHMSGQDTCKAHLCCDDIATGTAWLVCHTVLL